MYIALALTINLFINRFLHWHGRITFVVAIVMVLSLLASNAMDRRAVFLELKRTGGVGLSSDAIPRFAEESLRNSTPTHAFFPDWGVFMPFEMVTRGRFPITTGFAPQDAVRTLCAGQDVLLALTAGQGPDRLSGWIKEVGWGQPDLTVYRQHDGTPVLTAVRWHVAVTDHSTCPK